MADGVRVSWQDLIARLQGLGNHTGLCLVSVTAIIKDGRLVGWIRPRETRFEPTPGGEELLEALCNGEIPGI